jgi:hypothetical protein
MIALTETMMQAAESLLAKGETVEVVYVKGHNRALRAYLVGRGERHQTAVISTWSQPDPRHNKTVPFARVLLPEDALLKAAVREVPA